MKSLFHRFYDPPEGALFNNRQLFWLFLPILSSQLLASILALVDTLLAAELSDAATAGVSHGFIIYCTISTLITGLANGGSILVAQYFGSRNYEKACDSARCSLLLCIAVSWLMILVPLLAPKATVELLLGERNPETLEYAKSYLVISLLSLPIQALKDACTSTYHAQGNSRVPMITAVSVLVVSLTLKYLFINVFSMGVRGSALSNLIGTAVVSVWVFLKLTLEKTPVNFRAEGRKFLPMQLFAKTARLAFPCGAENASVQIGLLLVQRIITGYGVMESAAHAIGTRLQFLSYLPASCWGTVAMVVAGQCCGTGNAKLAQNSVRHILRRSFLWSIPVNLIWILLSPVLFSFFTGTPETLALARKLLVFYCAFSSLFYPLAFSLPQALRGGGDVRFTMLVSLIAMFLVRLCLAYVFGTLCGMRAFGVWLAMIVDWVVRSSMCVYRFYSRKWLRHDLLRS